MFGLFKKDPVAKLEKEYKRLLKESFKMSASNRSKADELAAQADKIAQQIDKLKEA